MTIREAASYLRGLPEDSRFQTVMREQYRNQGATPTSIEDLPPDYWGKSEHLLADIVDRLEILYWIQLDPKTRPSKPNFTPRPGTTKRKGASAWFGGLGLA